MPSGNVFRIVIFCSGLYSQVDTIQRWSVLSGSIKQILVWMETFCNGLYRQADLIQRWSMLSGSLEQILSGKFLQWSL